jgi:hypothetical protein
VQEQISDFGVGDGRLDSKPEDACQKEYITLPDICVVTCACSCHSLL